MAVSSSEGSPVAKVLTDDEKHSAQTPSREESNAPGYVEKNGLRTYGDGQDHDHEPPMTISRFMSFVSMGFLWVASQIPFYLYGAVPPYIYADIGGTDRWIWFILAGLLSLAAICPFVGSMSDILGRRYVSIIGGSLLILGMIICGTAKKMNVFIGGFVFVGIGAGIVELTALAVTAEVAPTRKRGTYVAILIFSIIPFCPSVLWAQLIASKSTHAWRYISLLCGLVSFFGVALTVIFYHPPPRPNSQGLSRSQVLARIDWVGGLLSISGMILFMAGLEWGGYQYAWKSAHVLVPLLLGAFLLIGFILWEMFGAKYPMFPGRLKQDPRVLVLTLIITFISGANFFSVLLFWPTQAFNLYGHDPIGVGIRGLPIAFSILAGAVIVLVLLSVLKGHNRELMIASSVIMTAGIGSLAVAKPDNINTVYGLLVLAGLGIGGIVVPASIITTIICPDDLIATVAALTLAIRVLGGAIGYAIYYNVFVKHFKHNVKYGVGTEMVKLGIWNLTTVTNAIKLTAASLVDEIAYLPGIAGNQTKYELVIRAGQDAYAASYRQVYLVSIAFGVVSIIAACFLGDIEKYMDDHVAVVI